MNLYLNLVGSEFTTHNLKINLSDSIPKAITDTVSNVDLSINDYFFLDTDRGVKQAIGTKLWKENRSNFFFRPRFKNLNGREFLDIRMFYFLEHKAFSFDIGFTNKVSTRTMCKTKFPFFYTNSGIKLGIVEKNFLETHNFLPYQISYSGKYKTYRYSSNSITVAFSSNVSVYESEYIFEKGILVHCRFGFIAVH